MTADPAHPDASSPADADWRRLLDARHLGLPAPIDVAEPWRSLYGPLLDPTGIRVIGQLGQSLDGRIATLSGHSHYVNGRPAIVHLHRLRALVDAVLVGVGTVVADDPLLTVRHVDGPGPWRVVMDPRGRVAPAARALADDGRRRIVVTGPDAAPALPAGVAHLRLPLDAQGRIAPAAVVAALGALGARRLLVEGGAFTVSRFVDAGCLDRLHVAVAPLIIGSGPTGLSLAPIERLDAALRPPVRCYALGDDVLWDVDLAAARPG